jgi:hypothetical protein
MIGGGSALVTGGTAATGSNKISASQEALICKLNADYSFVETVMLGPMVVVAWTAFR